MPEISSSSRGSQFSTGASQSSQQHAGQSVATTGVDAFLDFSQSNHQEVKGESKDRTNKEMFHVHTYSFGVIQTGTPGTGAGLGAGKAELTPFSFSIDTQLGSPKLFKHCAMGTHFSKVILHVRKAGGRQEEYLKVTMSDVLISSYLTGLGRDEVALAFRGVFMEYTPQKNDGSMDTGSTDRGGWDVQENVELTS